ncbi:acyl-coenzyme A thioesterase 3-like [Dunckerocampus dactyliophorus]|uniref:acyl-coenzyme A thioesterase 3-like n=1 Tax=Dunckerocampus dactyliophorus TaxID=161453 RepID=UPI002405890B|nr:acyl-coenzyme A thioesterase 3-like [Dunckerocampus dactyliophorus]XP_054624261.1 acyl-coenzyme A thioesterase 3-like [Dunckerocampus dactyliophorus]
MSPQVRLRLLPSARCLFDEPIQVKVDGLRSRQVVTMRAKATDERGVIFRSSAIYRADRSGKIEMQRDPALCGSYVGVEPMGLLWSMKADTPHKYFHWSLALNPHMVKFSVHDSVAEEDDGQALAEATNERCLIAEGVSRVVIKQGTFSGVLFTPPGEGPFPGVLDLCTFMSEKRASLLANKGFMVLAMAVFNDKPANIKHLNLDYFEEAVQFLQQQPKVGGKGIGVISRSKGGDIGLSLSSFTSGVEAVVWINGCSANIGYPLHYKNRQVLSVLGSNLSKVLPTPSGASIVKFGVGDPETEENQGSVVPIEKAKAHFLFVASEDDLNWDSKAFMEGMAQRLKREGKKNFETVCYPRAGHLLEPPYSPYCYSGLHGIVPSPVLWGGEPKAHIDAEVHLWKKIEDFFRTRLIYKL